MAAFLQAQSSWRNILVVALLAGAFAWLTVAVVGTQFAAVTSGFRPFDLQPGLKPEDIWIQLPHYTPASMRLYGWFFLLDIFLPLTAYGMVALIWANLLQAAAPGWYGRHRPVALFPFVPMLCDWGENLGFLGLILAYPRQWPWLADIALWLHWGKFAGMIIANAVIVPLALGVVLRRLSRR